MAIVKIAIDFYMTELAPIPMANHDVRHVALVFFYFDPGHGTSFLEWSALRALAGLGGKAPNSPNRERRW
jgi:hypothetical protein